jgi:hypothetical protein
MFENIQIQHSIYIYMLIPKQGLLQFIILNQFKLKFYVIYFKFFSILDKWKDEFNLKSCGTPLDSGSNI